MLLSAVVGMLAGVAGALMGILFLWGYKKFNPEIKGKTIYVIAAVVILCEIILSELISLAIIAAVEGVGFAEALSNAEVMRIVITNIAIGVVLSALVFGAYIFTTEKKKKDMLAQAKAQENMKAAQAAAAAQSVDTVQPVAPEDQTVIPDPAVDQAVAQPYNSTVESEVAQTKDETV